MRIKMRSFTLLFLAVFLATGVTRAQQAPGKPQSPDDVLRINTELVQTGVIVIDKQGRFVDGLTKEDFELQVEGRPVPISFFENVQAGSYRDRLTRTSAKSDPAADERSPAISIRQRNIVFFVDDRHLSLDGVGRTRKALLNFIDAQMGANDLVAISSASGRIGFLQQFTTNKEVLRAAVARLGHVPYVVTDYGKTPGTPMTEFMALTIERKDDPQVFDFYVSDCLKWTLKPPGVLGRSARVHCEVEVKNRARQLLMQAGAVTSSTYYSLETLLSSAERMPGSKLAFFFSDGFLADAGPRGSVGSDRLASMTDKARRAGVVIYTIDARGLISGALDATGNVPFDSGGRLEHANLREIAATQDALNALAADTGGRALRNQNYFDRFINEAVAETSRYYLIAWRPESDDQKDPKVKKIRVSLIGREDLTVRSARGFTNRVVTNSVVKDERTSQKEKDRSTQPKRPDADLRQALEDSLSSHALPVQLSLIYLDTPGRGAVVTSSVQAPTDSLSYGEQGKDAARLTIAGVVLDDEGKPAGSFRTGLKIDAPTANGANGANVTYNNPTALKPGIYQVRVAARDDGSRLVGSAMEWIVIPDLAKRGLSLSSLVVGIERVSADLKSEQLQWSVDKRFSQGSHLRFITFIYNAAGAGANAKNLLAQVKVYRDGRTVISQPRTKVTLAAETDAARIPLMSEIDLGKLQSGAYILEVKVEDLVANKSVSQQTTFYVR